MLVSRSEVGYRIGETCQIGETQEDDDAVILLFEGEALGVDIGVQHGEGAIGVVVAE